jgi:hypothetical protein
MCSKRLKIYEELMGLYPAYVAKFPQSRLQELMANRYGVSSVGKMTVEQCSDLVGVLKKGLEAA